MYDDNELSFTNRADHVMKNQKPKQVNIQIISKNSNPSDTELPVIITSKTPDFKKEQEFSEGIFKGKMLVINGI